MFAQVAEDTVVKDDVLGRATLYCTISGLTALDIGTEQFLADVHLAAGGVDEMAQARKFGDGLNLCNSSKKLFATNIFIDEARTSVAESVSWLNVAPAADERNFLIVFYILKSLQMSLWPE